MVILFICALVLLICTVGSFYWGRHIASIEQRNDLLETTHQEAMKHIEELEGHIEELAQENEYIRKEAEAKNQRVSPPRSWNPADPLNSNPRQ